MYFAAPDEDNNNLARCVGSRRSAECSEHAQQKLATTLDERGFVGFCKLSGIAIGRTTDLRTHLQPQTSLRKRTDQGRQYRNFIQILQLPS
jgi:hypothetical protein